MLFTGRCKKRRQRLPNGEVPNGEVPNGVVLGGEAQEEISMHFYILNKFTTQRERERDNTFVQFYISEK